MKVIVKFTRQMNDTIQSLNAGTPYDENGFVQVSNLVYDGVRSIRKAVLNNQVNNLAMVTDEKIETEIITNNQ